MSCSKIFSGNLPELMGKIINHFRNDFSTLHSCILVNRIWCRFAIPILWEDPFSNPSKNNRFIEIYFHYLNENDKAQLKEYGINNYLILSDTLFNYPTFIKCLNTQNIMLFVEGWVKNLIIVESYNTFSTQDTNFPLFPSSYRWLNASKFVFLLLIKIFINNGIHLHTFEVNILSDMDCNYFNIALGFILQNPNFIYKIKNLKFYFNEKIMNVNFFLKFLHYNCNSITSLHLRHSGVINYELIKYDLSKLIISQKNLENILFEHDRYGTLLPLNHLLSSLKFSNCLNTLKTIIFYEINFKGINTLYEVFQQLNALDSIHILYCYSLTLNSDFIQQIINLTKPFKLKSLFMEENNEILQIDSIQLLLQKSGDYLENIGFRSLTGDQIKQQLFDLVKNYCTKIKFFELLGFNKNNLNSVLDLIKNFNQSLNYLSIYDHNHPVGLSSIILQNLGQLLPFRLEYLCLCLRFNTNDFEIFLKNSQNTFIKKLVIRNQSRGEIENILPYIKKYIMKMKRVEYLAILENLFGNSEDLFTSMDEVEEFKSYNIKNKNYDDLYIQPINFIKEKYI
ncbi:hypothetical protein RhiirA1_537514 [Rhizophagus irregularis]|uniref:F-box domain-containing protein n=1 Tax=Rhizophagus irregularis TaxID=588596 RepID=A0A2N0RKF9_9GLOM|nr:hypothetical protein RhiirA1_537514 [Rhizophagus irregularis]